MAEINERNGSAGRQKELASPIYAEMRTQMF